MVTANVTTYLYIVQATPIMTKVDPIQEAEPRILNLDPGNQKGKGYVSIPSPDRGHMWVRPHILYANDWSSSTSTKPQGKNMNKKQSKGKGKAKSKSTTYNIVSASLRGADFDIIPYSNS